MTERTKKAKQQLERISISRLSGRSWSDVTVSEGTKLADRLIAEFREDLQRDHDIVETPPSRRWSENRVSEGTKLADRLIEEFRNDLSSRAKPPTVEPKG